MFTRGGIDIKVMSETQRFLNDTKGAEKKEYNIMELDEFDSKTNTNGGTNETYNKDSPRVSIIGFGNYGRALAHCFEDSGVRFVIGSNNNNALGEEETYGAKIMSHGDAVQQSDVIFLTAPCHSYQKIVEPLTKFLPGKTIIDVSNIEKRSSPCNALQLQSMVPLSNVVKALNTVSAYSLEQGSYGASRDTFVCGNNRTSKEIVMQILREIGLNPIDKGSLQSAEAIEKLPLRFFPGWGTASIITIATMIPCWFYTYLHFFWYNSNQVDQNRNDLGLYYPNRIIAWTMFWVLGLVYLPGIIAGFIQIWRGTKYSRFPSWLDKWMKCRKQLGLICLMLASIHGCASCLLIGAGELKHGLDKQYITQPGKNPVVIYQLISAEKQWSFLCACVSLALMGVVGITSLPSVNARMSWMEWDFIQRGFGFASFVFGFIHVMVYVNQLWNPNYKFGWSSWTKNPKGILPPAAFIMPMFPLLVIILKVILMFPGLSCYLNRIRKGTTGYKNSSVRVA